MHAVTVIQPVQTWTVIRGQDDFNNVSDNLSVALPDIPKCPRIDQIGGNLDALVSARHELQQWLSSILLFPGARESPALRSFLTYGANMIPPQHENVPWTMFAANGQIASTAPAPVQAPAEPTVYAEGLDDMVMDDMFDAGDDVGGVQHDDTDDEDEYRPSVRYKPTDEPISEEDAMDIALMASEVEMIEDVGSLAQSLGASHLGRSLRLQEEMSSLNKHTQQNNAFGQTGLQLGSAVSGAGGGGIGSAMANATPGLGGSFTQTKPESPPRLDAFKMIKVIGKGSFGTFLFGHSIVAAISF